ncbi:MAG: amidohydrolase family protein [Halieaceae bacterium]|nr:amidohydrolase family protein [Halieaceae bacterium]
MTQHDHPASPAGGCVLCQADNCDHDSPRAVERRHLLKASLAAPLLLAPGLSAAQSADSARPKSGAFVIRAGCALVVRNGDIAVDHDVSILVRDGVIEDVRSKPIRGFEVIDASGQLLLPGFISGHTHAASATPTRGIIEMGRSFARPLELVETLSDDELDALTAFNVMELLLGGSTTHLEMSLSLRQAQSYVRVARRWGVRGYPGGMVPGIARLFPIWFRGDDQVLLDSVEDTLAEIEANLAFARTINGVDNGRILPQVTPHAADTQTPETMRAHAAAAAELGNGIHIHLSQSARETETVKRLWGVTPAAWCKQFGFYDGPFFGAHMVGLDFKVDPPILNAAGAVYSHCPSGGGAGGDTQPYPEALAAGMKVNIGIDTHSNDYIENLKLAVLYGQARHSLIADSSTVPLQKPTIWDAVRGATLVAAEGLGRKDIGRIEPGARADLVGIDVSGPLVGTGALPPEPLNNLLYANGLSTRLVMTDGMVQVYEGRFVADSAARVAREGGAVVREIWSKLAAEGWFD